MNVDKSEFVNPKIDFFVLIYFNFGFFLFLLGNLFFLKMNITKIVLDLFIL